MPYVEHAGVRIYYLVQGEGPPLVLHHGLGGNVTSFIQLGYAKGLRDRHRLILIDARGHGQSAKPYEPSAYELRHRVADVTAVLDALAISRVDFFGYSMGGWIGYGMAEYAPARLRSLILGGAHPFRDPLFDEFGSLDGSDPNALLHAIERVIGDEFTEEGRRLMLLNDLRALGASLKERMPLDDLPPRIDVPCLLFAGRSDPRHDIIARAAGQIRTSKFVSVPGLGHLQTLMSAPAVLPFVKEFLGELSG